MADVGFFSAVTAVFGAGFAASRKVVDVDGSVVQSVSFPGGYNVACLEGRLLLDDEVADDVAWQDLRLDLFVSAEEALVAMQTIDAAAVKTFLSVDNLVTHAQDKYRKVRIKPQTNVHTFVPSSVLMGLTLLHQHKFDIARKIRFSTLVARSLERSLELYPRIAREPTKVGADTAATTDASRFAELGVTTEEFELTQKAKYAACYRTMRALIPPNIAKTDLKTMIADGVPRKVARHIWERKALWLICMHPSDVPRVHIADLRGKYVAHCCTVAAAGVSASRTFSSIPCTLSSQKTALFRPLPLSAVDTTSTAWTWWRCAHCTTRCPRGRGTPRTTRKPTGGGPSRCALARLMIDTAPIRPSFSVIRRACGGLKKGAHLTALSAPPRRAGPPGRTRGQGDPRRAPCRRGPQPRLRRPRWPRGLRRRQAPAPPGTCGRPPGARPDGAVVRA